MIKKLLLGVLFAIAINSFSQTTNVIPNIDWVKNYANRNTLNNVPTAIDGNSNVYATGYTNNGLNSDLVVLKYDSLGTLLWAKSYNSGGTDYGSAIRVDASGNVFVTGYSNGDILIAMYNSAGVQQWLVVRDRTGEPDAGVDIQFDGTYVYVLCTTSTGNPDKDISIYKYDLSGSLVANFDYDAYGYDDIAVGFVKASNGDLLVVGNCFDGSKFTVHGLRFDNSIGSILSYSVFSGTGSGDNTVKAIIIDSNDDLIFTGSFNNSTTNDDYFTIKSDVNFSAYWQKSYDVSNGNEYATALVKDSANNIAVTGYRNNGSAFQYHTLKYNPSGTMVWNTANIENTGITSMNVEPRIVCDTIAHHFYVSGQKLNANKDVSVYQITPGGNTTWKKQYNGAGNGLDGATNLVVNGIGVIYVSALTTNTASGYDITTIKISQTPVYFPVNYTFQSDTFSYSNLFYPNSGEVIDTAGNPATNVLFYTKFTYPNQYILKDRVAFCEFHQDSLAGSISDTLSRVDMILVNSNLYTTPQPLNIQNISTLNYFLAQTGTSGITNVKGASHLIVPNVYPLIDLFYTSNSIGSKYYFVVKPGGNPKSIRLQIDGSTTNTIVSNNLKITSALGSWTFNKPDIYNVDPFMVSTPTVTGTNGWYYNGGNIYSFNTGTYNISLPLIIEFDMGKQLTALPSNSLNCEWSTYVGGSNSDYATNIKSDANNNLFVTGASTSNNFPPGISTAVFQTGNAGNRDGFIDKYDDKGQRLWSTFVGGNQFDAIKSIDFATNGDIYAVGQTQSTLVTMSKAGATNSLSPLGLKDVFILQVSSNSSLLKWLTYYGGSLNDDVYECKFDALGNFFMVGNSTSTNVPLVGSTPQYTQTHNDVANATDGFIAKYNTSSQITWATFLGSTTGPALSPPNESLRGLDFDSNNDLYVVGFANGSDYPNIVNGNSTNYGYFGTSLADGVISRFSNAGQIKWSSYMGGSNVDYFTAIKIKNNKIYVTGYSASVVFPLKNSGNWYYSSASTTTVGGGDALFLEYNTNDSLLHSTRIAGNNNVSGYDIEVDSTNRVYISGQTLSSVFPLSVVQPTNAYVDAFKGTAGLSDNFIVTVAPSSTNIVWATDLGGTNDEGFNTGNGSGLIDINKLNILHITGVTLSNTLFPLYTGPIANTYFDGTYNGNEDVTVTRFYLYPINFVNYIKDATNDIAEFTAYPNPTQNIINVKLLSNNTKANYTIYNTMGQVVKQGVFENELNEVELSNLAQGMYLIEVTQKNKKTVVKFIKNG